ncbi:MULTISPECIES: glyoxalase/bleomycin resistance/extradiol dioxygenase family protein [Burkholderia]|uniref:PhnB protein n=1 Tax=Burkholderia pyrrocinia TaxID=60550 RepID=A0A318INS9_BURPY|nr:MULTISPECIES: VOC family protein [Burkholderia]PXX37099.1 PhnB protein [Burkholderia pyrrocinia]SFW49644.1 PhnB protein [Burkholderia sp. NFACC33-1]SFX99099.1 PhnB protein [Burkholderia sp. NFPP32]
MHVPPGFSIVTPYIFVDGAEAYIAFLEHALGGRERGRSLRPDGKIANAQISFGPSTVMVSEALTEFPASSAAFYLYVEDADRAVKQAVASGAELVMAVADMPYGDRQGGVRDIAGNIWWVSQRLTAEPYFKA